MYYTYIIRCRDGSYYCGYTNNLEKRFEMHKSGRGAKYTRAHIAEELVYCESFETKSEAMSREWHIKQMSHAEKERLISLENGHDAT